MDFEYEGGLMHSTTRTHRKNQTREILRPIDNKNISQNNSRNVKWRPKKRSSILE